MVQAVKAQGTKQNPLYYTFLIDGIKQYNLTPAVVSLDISDQEKQMAKNVKVSIMNVLVQGTWLTSIVKVRQRLFIYADDGEKMEEVFRGFIWSWDYRSAMEEREITLNAYDNLIYFQESEESEYFSAGKSTQDVLSSLCEKWGIRLEYNYKSITHDKLPLRGNLADIWTDDLLDLVKDRTGIKYVILSVKDAIQVNAVGSNTQIYCFQATENAILTKTGCTMNGMITKCQNGNHRQHGRKHNHHSWQQVDGNHRCDK